MTEPRDPFEDWLTGPPVEPLAPPPGRFDTIARSARRRRWGRAAGTAAAVIVLLGGVGAAIHSLPLGDDDPAGPGTTSSPSTGDTPTPVPTPTPTVTPATAPSRTAPAGPTRCGAAGLAVTVVPGDNAAGHIGLQVVFSNTSGQPCTLTGYPGIVFVTAAASPPRGSAAQHAGGPPTTVTIAPGKAARADLLLTQVANYPTNSCQPVQVAGVRVSVPDDPTQVFAASPSQICSVTGVGVAQVYPFQTGT